MAIYEFSCPQCGIRAVRAPMATGPEFQSCEHGVMQRIYAGARDTIINLGMSDYVEKAYRGEEQVAGMNTGQIKAVVNAQVRRHQRGRANNKHSGKIVT